MVKSCVMSWSLEMNDYHLLLWVTAFTSFSLPVYFSERFPNYVPVPFSVTLRFLELVLRMDRDKKKIILKCSLALSTTMLVIKKNMAVEKMVWLRTWLQRRK